MTYIGPISWFLMLVTFGILTIAVFIIRSYSNRYRDIKDQIHTIHAFIELIDESLTDDQVTKDEFTCMVKRCLSVLRRMI